jgi:hypothetical protein
MRRKDWKRKKLRKYVNTDKKQQEKKHSREPSF